jgi:hypothetical protein
MKLTNILFAGLLALTFTSTANAENFKMKTCIIAETSFWDAYKGAYDSSEHSFVDSLSEENKEAYFNLHKGDLQKKMDEVRHRCKTMDKVIESAYEKKMSELQDQLNKLH